MVSSHRSKTRGNAAAGFSMMELTCAFAVLAVMLSVNFLGTGSKLAHVRTSYQETLALRAASGWLEQLQGHQQPLQIGTHAFSLPAAAGEMLPGAQALQTVELLEPGLYEAVATVTWRPVQGGRLYTTSLRTLIAQE